MSLSINSFAKKSTDRFCGKRISPTNYPRFYKNVTKNIISFIKNHEKLTIDKLLDKLLENTNEPNTEICKWNQFTFVDFILYFAQIDQLGLKDQEANIMRRRDELYREWYETLENQDKNNYAEWANHELTNLSLDQFLKKGSQKFRFFEFVSKTLNPKIKKVDVIREKKRARYIVQKLLTPRSPFNSIFPKLSLTLAEDENINRAVSCLNTSLDQNNCNQTIWQEALNCTQSQEQALQILGVLSSQRMYLIRDFKSYLEQNKTSDKYELIMDTLTKASHIYFQSETKASICGSSTVYPQNINAHHTLSRKSYHFWSVAYIAYYLGRLNFSKDITIKESTRSAIKYKKFIRLPAFIYNLKLGVPLGTNINEFKGVVSEQKLGANFGRSLSLIEDE